MNDVTRGAALPPEYSQLLADFPRFSADVMPHDGAAEWHLSTEAVAAGIEAGRKLFPMPEVAGDTRFQAQLWWWSMCGALVGPSLACVLVSDRVPVWQWSSWFAFLRDDYWVGFQAQQFESISAEDADELKDSGEALAHFLDPLAQVVGEVGEIKPAPLWAVAADAVANAAISAGNERLLANMSLREYSEYIGSLFLVSWIPAEARCSPGMKLLLRREKNRTSM